MKACVRCGVTKELTAFRQRKSGSSPTCRACHAETATRWRQANPDKVRQYNEKQRAKDPDKGRHAARVSHFKRKFGLTLEEREGLTRQGKCDICGTTQPQKKGWCIDHDHKTKRIRGILCQKCNVLIGLANESPEILAQAITYIEAHDASRPTD